MTYNIIKVLKESGYIKEYLNREEVSQVRYFNMSEEEKKKSLLYTFHYLLDNYTEDEIEDSIDYAEQIDGTEKGMQIASQLYDDLVNNNLDVFEEDKPAWSYFDYRNIVKNQWLIHFTNDADSIAKEGFTQGVFDIERLALTTRISDFEKQYGGYNFAYLLSEYRKHLHK